MSKFVMTPDGKKQVEMSLEERLDKLILIYELEAQSIIGRMPEFEKKRCKALLQSPTFLLLAVYPGTQIRERGKRTWEL